MQYEMLRDGELYGMVLAAWCWRAWWLVSWTLYVHGLYADHVSATMLDSDHVLMERG